MHVGGMHEGRHTLSVEPADHGRKQMLTSREPLGLCRSDLSTLLILEGHLLQPLIICFIRLNLEEAEDGSGGGCASGLWPSSKL